MKLINVVVFLVGLLIGSIAYAQTVEQWLGEYGWIFSNEYDHFPTNEEITEMMGSLDNVLKQNSNHPVLWHAKGVLVNLKYGNYYDRTFPLGEYSPNNPEAQALIKEYQSYYIEALKLNDDPNAPGHLTGDMLATIADDVLAPPDLKERALRKEMELARTVGGRGEHEGYEWNTFAALLGTYMDAKDYDSYLKTVNEMMERFPGIRTEELLRYKEKAETLIEERDRKSTSE